MHSKVETLVSAPETNTFSVKHEHYADSDSDSSTNTSLKHCAIQDESVEELSTDIEYVASNITHIITCLNKLSMIIQSPAPRDRLHKSQTIPVAHLLPYEILHVQDKFPQVPDFLVERLARANVARRQMLKYYQHHQGGIVAPAGPEFSSDHHPVIDQTLPAAGSTRKSLEPLVICVDRKKEGTISTIPSSQTTISAYIAGLQELTSDPLSLAEVESEGGISQTSFESLSGGMGGSYVPDAPSLLNDAPFQCPYCFLIIRPKNRDSWLWVNPSAPCVLYCDQKLFANCILGIGGISSKTCNLTYVHLRIVQCRNACFVLAKLGIRMRLSITGNTGFAKCAT